MLNSIPNQITVTLKRVGDEMNPGWYISSPSEFIFHPVSREQKWFIRSSDQSKDQLHIYSYLTRAFPDFIQGKNVVFDVIIEHGGAR